VEFLGSRQLDRLCSIWVLASKATRSKVRDGQKRNADTVQYLLRPLQKESLQPEELSV
jgi:hypothetical protein